MPLFSAYSEMSGKNLAHRNDMPINTDDVSSQEKSGFAEAVSHVMTRALLCQPRKLRLMIVGLKRYMATKSSNGIAIARNATLL